MYGRKVKKKKMANRRVDCIAEVNINTHTQTQKKNEIKEKINGGPVSVVVASQTSFGTDVIRLKNPFMEWAQQQPPAQARPTAETKRRHESSDNYVGLIVSTGLLFKAMNEKNQVRKNN